MKVFVTKTMSPDYLTATFEVTIPSLTTEGRPHKA